jgi:hypothetical protein
VLRSEALCLCLVLATAACDSQIVLGDSELGLPIAGASGKPSGDVGSIAGPGKLVWSTDHEVGDFGDWQRGGTLWGGEYQWGNADGYVDLGVGRQGSNGVVANIDSVPRGDTSSGVRMYRRIEPGPAYYRCWFRLEEAHRVADWWSIFLFHATDENVDLDNDVSLWDVRVVDTPSGEMALQFFDHDVMQGLLSPGSGLIQPQKWFELSAYLDYRPPNDTRLVVWLDGAQLFDMMALHTAAHSTVLWSVGNGASQLDPEESTLYLDDAAVLQAATP